MFFGFCIGLGLGVMIGITLWMKIGVQHVTSRGFGSKIDNGSFISIEKDITLSNAVIGCEIVEGRLVNWE